MELENFVAWIESHQQLREHPKVYALMEALEIPKSQAIGHLHLLWWWCIDYAPTGDLSNLSRGRISGAAEWPGDGNRFVEALVKTGWVDQGPDSLRVHDWLEFCGVLIEKRLLRAGKKRKFMESKNFQKLSYRTEPNPTEQNRTEGEEVASASSDFEAAKTALDGLSPLSRLWNMNCPHLPQVKEMNRERMDKERLRLKERSIEQWAELFRKMENSDFCRGKNERKWKGSFDWIIANQNNSTKVREGKYDNDRSGNPEYRSDRIWDEDHRIK